ncbi:MAG: GNAT family N-acetyltransferase [Desulfobulbaceae bacterium]|nr:GNAT family N-acetyltransferase [Desulfobulbaceae bacterium]
MSKASNNPYDENWREKYCDMISTPQQAVAKLRPGNRVFVSTGCAAPYVLTNAMMERAGELSDVEIIHLLTKGEAPYAEKRFADVFTVNSFFIGHNVRELIQQGMGGYTPILLSDIPKVFKSGQLPLDVAMIQVTPPNEQGMVCLGISVDIVKSAAENASLVIAQVNPQMPWTHGDALMDIHNLDMLVPADTPLLERESRPMNPATVKIAQYIASLIEDGSTIEFGMGRLPGVGRIPPAVMNFIQDKKDLGIHTEMITDSIFGLLESGAITGNSKSIDRGKIVTSFCMGTKKLYDLVNDNPLFSFQRTEYVNNPHTIGRQNRMVSINIGLEIDLTGQVCVDSIGSMFYSGIGGQVDFNRGAANSSGGKPIIVLAATDAACKTSRIVTNLSVGAGVGITRGEVHYVVTEFGIAYLHGKNVQDRALALISIAHPDFREQLLEEAINANYLNRDMRDVEGKFMISADDMKTVMVLDNGSQINFRAIHPTDEPGMRELLYALSQETLYYRFMTRNQRFGHKQIHNFVYVDHRRDVAIVATVPAAHGDQIVAVGRYYLNERTNMAEVAFVIRDNWQNRGIGKFLFKHLVSIAKRSGIAGFTAEVLRENKRMQAIFNHCGMNVKSSVEEDVYSFQIVF